MRYIGAMCGRYVSGTDELTWRQWVAILRGELPSEDERVPEELTPRPVQPGSEVVALVRAEAGGPAFSVLRARWGFVMPSARGLYFNLRAETAATRFATLARGQRCAVPAMSFELASGESGARNRERYRVQGPSPLLLAGLWDDGAGDAGRRITVLTRASSPELAPIHERAPLLVPPERLSEWLGGVEAAPLIRDLCSAPGPAFSVEKLEAREAPIRRR